VTVKKPEPIEVKTETVVPISITIDPESLIQRAGSTRV
jgi:hypothetical protein